MLLENFSISIGGTFNEQSDTSHQNFRRPPIQIYDYIHYILSITQIKHKLQYIYTTTVAQQFTEHRVGLLYETMNLNTTITDTTLVHEIIIF